MRLPLAPLLILVVACGSKASKDGSKSSEPASAKSTSPVKASGSPKAPSSSAPASSSAASAVAPAVSASSAPAVPLSDAAADRPKLTGWVAISAKVGGEGPNLYAASLDKVPLELKKLSDGAQDWSPSEPAIDPTGKLVAFVHNHHEKPGAPPDEVWTVPIDGGTAKKLVKCTATCRSPQFLDDGRIVYVDHGAGLAKGVIRVATPSGSASPVYGTDRSVNACFLAVRVDPTGKLVVASISNELGWPECTVDFTATSTSKDPKKMLNLPPMIPGRSHPQAGEDGRVYFVVGTEDKPIPSSCGADGKDIRSPDPTYDGVRVPRAGWRIEADKAKLVARPPVGDTHPSLELVEVDEISNIAQTTVH